MPAIDALRPVVDASSSGLSGRTARPDPDGGDLDEGVFASADLVLQGQRREARRGRELYMFRKLRIKRIRFHGIPFLSCGFGAIIERHNRFKASERRGVRPYSILGRFDFDMSLQHPIRTSPTTCGPPRSENRRAEFDAHTDDNEPFLPGKVYAGFLTYASRLRWTSCGLK